MHLKLILNSSCYKDKISFSNKDFYLYDLICRKRKEKIENSILSSKDNIHNSKVKINSLFKDSNAFNKLKDISQILKKSEDSKKIFEPDLKFILKKPSKKMIKFNSVNFIKQNKTEKFDISKKIKIPLLITPLSKNNAIFIPRKNYGRNKLKKIQKSYTTMYYKRNEEILKNNILSITPIKKNLIFKSNKTNKISEGTQINTNLFNEIIYVNNKKNSSINKLKYKYCSSKNIIFHKKLKKIKSEDFYYRYI